MTTGQINYRVDSALVSNRRAEHIIIGMSVGIFAIGAATLLIAYGYQNPYLGSGTIVLNGFLYWPIREILKLRRDNIMLQVLPGLLELLPPADAAKEIKKLAEYLRGKS